MNKKMWVIAYKIMWGIYPISGGGGGEKATVVQAPASAPTPSATETAGDIYKARLQYDPLTSALEMQQQQQYMPQQAALYQSLFNQYAPQMARTQQQTQRELYPYQSQLVEQGAQQALQRLQNPDYMTPQEQQALEANRTKEVTSLQAAMRNRANMGGTLYGGRSAAEETEA